MNKEISHYKVFRYLHVHVSTGALLYREGPPVPGLDTPGHVPGALPVGGHGLVPGLGLVHEVVRLEVVREDESPLPI